MGTVSPSPTTIRSSTPANAEGISVSTLSVDTSSSGSSIAISSPSDRSHRVTVPSVTVSPSCGIVMRGTGASRPPSVLRERSPWGSSSNLSPRVATPRTARSPGEGVWRRR